MQDAEAAEETGPTQAEPEDTRQYGDTSLLGRLVGRCVEVTLSSRLRSLGQAYAMPLRTSKIIAVTLRVPEDAANREDTTTIVEFDDGGTFEIVDWAYGACWCDTETDAVTVHDELEFTFTPVKPEAVLAYESAKTGT